LDVVLSSPLSDAAPSSDMDPLLEEEPPLEEEVPVSDPLSILPNGLVDASLAPPPAVTTRMRGRRVVVASALASATVAGDELPHPDPRQGARARIAPATAKKGADGLDTKRHVSTRKR
jgi:hypothetical protein